MIRNVGRGTCALLWITIDCLRKCRVWIMWGSAEHSCEDCVRIVWGLWSVLRWMRASGDACERGMRDIVMSLWLVWWRIGCVRVRSTPLWWVGELVWEGVQVPLWWDVVNMGDGMWNLWRKREGDIVQFCEGAIVRYCGNVVIMAYMVTQKKNIKIQS